MTKAKGAPLTPQEKRACELYALEGKSKTDSFRIGLEKKVAAKVLAEKPYYFKNRAWEFFNRPYIMDYVDSVLETARAEDCMRVGRAVRELQDCIDDARERQNDTAVSQLLDKKLKVMGLMRDNNRFVLSAEGSMDDDTLIEALSGGDPALEAQLKKLVTKDSFDH